MHQPELKDHINLLRKITWNYHKRTGLDWDDLFQEAYIGYWHAVNQHDKDKGSLSTIIWHCVGSQLQSYIDSEYKYKYENKFVLEEIPERYTTLHSIYDDLDPRASELVAEIVEHPFDFIAKRPNDAKRKIADRMISKGWQLRDVWKAIKNIKIALQFN